VSQTRTAAEVRSAKIAAMGQELGELRFELSTELIWLHVKWQWYRELFAVSQEQVDLLNRSAPDFFGFLFEALLDDVLLHMGRLTDPPRSAGRDTLSVKRLPLLISDGRLKNRVVRLLKRLDAKVQKVRIRRNKFLAHRDLAAVLKKRPNYLPSRKKVEETLAVLRAVLNEVENHYEKGRTAYDHSIGPLGGPFALIRRLEVADEVLATKRSTREGLS
jgi:hypothetical protein